MRERRKVTNKLKRERASEMNERYEERRKGERGKDNERERREI
jgi:hypothetical protein